MSVGESGNTGTEAVTVGPVGTAVAPPDAGTPSTTPDVQSQAVCNLTPLQEKKERDYGIWMTEKLRGGYRGRGRGRGGGAGRGRGAGRSSQSERKEADDHVTTTKPVLQHVTYHKSNERPDLNHIPDEMFAERLDVVDHVSDQVDIPATEQVPNLHADNLDRGRSVGRPVRRSIRGGHTRDGYDDRLINFVRKRASRERSTEGLQNPRARSRLNPRRDHCQVDKSPTRGLNPRSHRKLNPLDKDGSPDPRDETDGDNLLITSLKDAADQGRRSINPKGKGLSQNPILSSHRYLVCRLSKALANEETEMLSDGDTNEDDDPPDRGEGHQEGHDNKLPKVPSRGVQKILPIEIPAITLAELNKMTNNFRPKALIAEGSYGRIYYGVLSSGQPAAIKKLDPATCQELPEPDFAAQISLVSRLNNEYFLELLGYCLEADNRILIHQYASNGSLHDILHGRRGVQNDEPGVVLTWNQRVKIAYGAARGLEYLHEKVEPPIVHRDIRSSNVLLFDDYAPKIADFNLANQPTDCLARLHSTRVLGTFGYHAPEYAMIGQLTQKGDVYSFGVVLLELLTGRKPVDHTLPKGQQSLVTWATPRLSEDKVKQCVDPKLNNEYPPKAVAKLAAVAALCIQYEADFRPNMTIIVKALQPLLNSKPIPDHQI
ncbi:hypothetical protein J5N97_006815 [Dioscorea zingiberensis]|uniref:Protein kinase domain-containing protein n=1 Tax=Dioscorea zingiberensis TaxID=325984 RepID=A0A9D5HTM1_9LILI|nr:hypothetical protein J5N97_006815 [Dioscorea zingiberensis]